MSNPSGFSKWNTMLIALPSLGIGVYWSLAGTFAPWIIYTTTNSATKVLALVAMGPFTGIFVQYLAGVISDRTNSKWGRRTPWILGGLLVACVSQVAWALAPNYFVLFVVGFITYFAVNFYQGPYYTMVYEVVPSDKIGFATVFARFMAGIGGAGISYFSADIWRYGGTMGACIAVVLLLAIPTLLVIPFGIKENKFSVKKQSTEKIKYKFDLFKHKSATQLFFAVLFLYLATGPISAIMTPYFVKYKGFSEQTLAHALGIGGLTGLITTVVLSKFIDKVNPRKLFQGLLIFDIFVFAFGSMISKSIPAFYMFHMMVGLMGVSYPIMFTLLPRVAPQERLGEFQGFLNMFLSIGDFTMTICNGLLIDAGHPDLVLKVEIIFVVIAFLIMLPNLDKKDPGDKHLTDPNTNLASKEPLCIK